MSKGKNAKFTCQCCGAEVLKKDTVLFEKGPHGTPARVCLAHHGAKEELARQQSQAETQQVTETAEAQA